jgi:hypothetical protein
MTGLESQEEDTLSVLSLILFFKTMSWEGQIRPHLIDEDWSPSLWKTFIVMTMGTQIPVITEKSLTASGWRKFQLDTMGDHLCTCTSHSGVKQVMTGWLIN